MSRWKVLMGFQVQDQFQGWRRAQLQVVGLARPGRALTVTATVVIPGARCKVQEGKRARGQEEEVPATWARPPMTSHWVDSGQSVVLPASTAHGVHSHEERMHPSCSYDSTTDVGGAFRPAANRHSTNIVQSCVWTLWFCKNTPMLYNSKDDMEHTDFDTHILQAWWLTCSWCF